MPDEKTTPARLAELPEETRLFLAGLRPDELDALSALVKMPSQDIEEGFKLVRDFRTVTRALRWTILTVIAIFIGGITLYENFLKFIGYLKGTKI